ncbi:MAG: SLBB domain-containing protein [Chthoniobacteraceae bacterium]
MTHRIPIVIGFIALLLGNLAAQAQSRPPGAPGFKDPKIGIYETPAPVTPNPASRGSASIDDLEEKRETLEREIQYGKTKLEAAQKKLAVQSAVGNAEQVEKLSTEIKDWEARVKVGRDELDAVEQEINRLRPSPMMGEHDVIVPGENVEIFVNEDPSFNGRYQVRRGGYIILAQVGRVMLVGKSLTQAEAAVKRALEGSQLTRATVMLERISGLDVETGPLIFLSGAFKNPRPYRIPSGTAPTLVSLILSCGGVTKNADITRVKIMRMAGGKSVVEEVDLAKILAGGGLNSDITLTEGDVITIPAGPANLVFITGNVRRPGSFSLAEGDHLSAYGAILKHGGGLSRFADEKNAHVLRAMPDGTKRKIPVNLVDLKKGRKPDVELEPNDIIVVPEKWFSF